MGPRASCLGPAGPSALGATESCVAYGSATAGLAYTIADEGGEVIRTFPYRFALHGEPRMKCLGGA
jgi:hypothetical protein